MCSSFNFFSSAFRDSKINRSESIDFLLFNNPHEHHNWKRYSFDLVMLPHFHQLTSYFVNRISIALLFVMLHGRPRSQKTKQLFGAPLEMKLKLRQLNFFERN